MKTAISHVKGGFARGAAMLFAAMLSFSALADSEMVLWWLVGEGTDNEDLSDIKINTFHEGQQTAESMGVKYARMRVVDTEPAAYLPVVSLDADGNVISSFPVSSIPGEAYSSVITPYASAEYSFMIELGNWDANSGTWTMVAMSDVMSYTQLVDGGHVGVWSGETIDAQNPAAWAVSTYTVPEPTGGLLFVVGGALLALRRRRRRAGE